MRKDFSEIEFQVALMMGYYFVENKIDDLGFYMPSAREENRTYAADWFLENCKGVNLFLQFKKSHRCHKDRYNLRSQQLINNERQYREINSEVYEFPVRKNSNHLQHNLLFSNLNQPNSLAFYVAPLFTSRAELLLKMKCWINSEDYSNEYSYRLLNDNIRVSPSLAWKHFSFFEDVIYIKPHRNIDDENQHHYCFSKRRQVSFHSEIEHIKNGGNSFSGVLRELIKSLNKSNMSLLESTDNLFELIKKTVKDNNIKEYRDYQIDRLLNTSINDSDNMLIQIEALRNEKKWEEYIFAVNGLIEELFEISRIFVYQKGF